MTDLTVIETEIAEAQEVGDQERANAAYAQHLEALARDNAVTPPAVDNLSKPKIAEGTSVATWVAEKVDAGPVQIEVGFDYRDPAHVQAAVDAMDFWNGGGTELQHRWGGDFAANMIFAQGALTAYPEFLELFQREGMPDHPVFMEAASMMGRMLSQVPGDPRTVQRLEERDIVTNETNDGKLTKTNIAASSVDPMDDNAYQSSLDEIRARTTEAQSQGDDRKANRLYQETMAMIEAREGNSPLVGKQGRTA